MSVAEVFANFDANTMFDNALARYRRVSGVRAMPSTTNVNDYLETQGVLFSNDKSMDDSGIVAANESTKQKQYQPSLIARRWERRVRRANRV